MLVLINWSAWWGIVEVACAAAPIENLPSEMQFLVLRKGVPADACLWTFWNTFLRLGGCKDGPPSVACPTAHGCHHRFPKMGLCAAPMFSCFTLLGNMHRDDNTIRLSYSYSHILLLIRFHLFIYFQTFSTVFIFKTFEFY